MAWTLELTARDYFDPGQVCLSVERRANCDRRPVSFVGIDQGVSWPFDLTVYIEAQQPTLIL